MSRYNAEFPFPVAYPPQAMTNVLAEWLSKHDVKQAHIAGQSCAIGLFTKPFFSRITVTLTPASSPSRGARRDRKVCTCHFLLQWRHREAVRRGRAAHDRFAKSRDVRQAAEDECAGRRG